MVNSIFFRPLLSNLPSDIALGDFIQRGHTDELRSFESFFSGCLVALVCLLSSLPIADSYNTLPLMYSPRRRGAAWVAWLWNRTAGRIFSTPDRNPLLA